MKKFKYILEKYKFLATSPIKIDFALGVIAFCLLFIFFAIDFINESGASFGKVIFLILCILIILACLKFIADLPETPKKYDHEDLNFDYRKSLRVTRNLQRMLVMPVEDSSYVTSSRTRIAKNNNALRLSAFVAVFKNEAFIFIRNSEKISYSRDIEDMQKITDRIARQLGLKATKLQMIDDDQSLPLGHSLNKEYFVAHLTYKYRGQ